MTGAIVMAAQLSLRKVLELVVIVRVPCVTICATAADSSMAARRGVRDGVRDPQTSLKPRGAFLLCAVQRPLPRDDISEALAGSAPYVRRLSVEFARFKEGSADDCRILNGVVRVALALRTGRSSRHVGVVLGRVLQIYILSLLMLSLSLHLCLSLSLSLAHCLPLPMSLSPSLSGIRHPDRGSYHVRGVGDGGRFSS